MKFLWILWKNGIFDRKASETLPVFESKKIKNVLLGIAASETLSVFESKNMKIVLLGTAADETIGTYSLAGLHIKTSLKILVLYLRYFTSAYLSSMSSVDSHRIQRNSDSGTCLNVVYILLIDPGAARHI